MSILERANRIYTLLDEKKAENVEVIDVSGSDYFVDAVVIATTLAGKHAISLVDYLKTILKPEGENFLHVDESDEWTIVDLGDILVHLMSDEYRKRYNLEEFLKDFTPKR